MSKQVTLKLDRNDAGQMVDGLRCRAESYRNTEDCFNGIVVVDAIEVVSSADEARAIAEHYERIIDTISQQMKAQDEQ